MIFTKYHGIGNDFILIDQRQSPIEENAFLEQVPNLCDRHLGIGADGVLLLESSQIADVKMRIFNSDGSEANMCGNGIRCAADYEMKTQVQLNVETKGGVFTCFRRENQVGVDLKQPLICHWPFVINQLDVYVVRVGVLHAVVFLPSLDQIDLIKIAKEIRVALPFSPEGVNVNLACFSGDKLVVRTYERGVERETLSCGTGFAAVAFIASKLYLLSQPILIASTSPKKLEHMRFFVSNKGNVEMIAQACLVFSGTLALS